MKPRSAELERLFLAQSRHSLAAHHLPRIVQCLKLLSGKEVWWRPNAASNSVGNLVLHLAGNVRQWTISGLGGAPDHRDRDREFAERVPIPRRALLALLRKTVSGACLVLQRLSPDALSRTYTIQGFRVTGLIAVSDVVQHFAYHSGQIIFITKLRRGKDLRFTRLPNHKRKKSAAGVP